MGRNKSRARNLTNAAHAGANDARQPTTQRPRGEQQLTAQVWEQIVKAIRALEQPTHKAA
ncbi:MAG: hypothetical protein U0228_05860 [Myxococcaceae bacterium]